MQAVIMAGGKGTRLQSITHDEVPKPMAILAGKPILQYQVECLKSNGITKILIVTGYLGNKIEEYFADGSRFGVKISYYREQQPLGTAGALALIEKQLEETFLLVFGDIIFDLDIERMERFHHAKLAEATLFVHPNSHPFDSDIVLTEEHGRVIGIDSKNNTRDYWYHNQVNAGFYVLQRSICNYIKPELKTDLEIDVLLPLVSRGGAVYAYCSPEYIKDVGTPERIAATTRDIEVGVVSARNLRKVQKCVFLDRDGTVNCYKGLVSKEDEFVIEAAAAEAIHKLNVAGWLVIVVTNQPVVARGMCSIEKVESIHAKMETLLGYKGAYLNDCVFCPHHPDKGYPEENPFYKVSCECRKPKIKLLTDCAEKYHIDLSQSWVVGDTTVDIQTGINAGAHTALVQTGLAGTDCKYSVCPEYSGKDLIDVVEYILKGDESK